MGNKKKNLKRIVTEIDKKEEEIESNEEDDFFNVVNGEDADSSDSDREIEDSEDESNQLVEEESEADSDDISNENSGKDTESEESDENSEGSEGEEVKDSSEKEETGSSSEETEVEEKSEDETELVKKPSKAKQINRNLNQAREEDKAGRNDVSITKEDEYGDYDTSDEEDIRNTVGNIPMNWYDEYKHLGYDWDGNQILKPETGDQLDAFLKKMEDPDFWRTVKDPQTGQDVVLSEEDMQLIKRIKAQKIPDVTFDEYAPWIEWFTSEVEQMPIRKFPEHKRSFLPSKHEAKKVSKLVHALKMGWIKTRAEQEKLRAKKEPQFYMLWQTDDQAEEMRRIHKHIPAPKRLLPGTVWFTIVTLKTASRIELKTH